jgi:SAM-dependent methyltransferase
MVNPSNADQSELWNAQFGETWVREQSELDALLGSVADLVLASSAPQPGERVLDIGCGAGATTFALARATGPDGGVEGVDISAPLLAHAERRRAALGIANARFTLADAQDHRFPPAEADLIASRFGVMFFDDPLAAFGNLAHALRPGGRLVFAAWAGPEHNPWFTVPQRIASARLGDVPPVPPEAPGPMAFRDIPRLIRLLSEAGFADVSGERADIDLHHPGDAAEGARLASQIGPIARILREKDGTPEDHAAILAALTTEFAAFRAPDGLRIPAGINLFTARRS